MEKHQVLVWPENREAVQIFLALSVDWIKPNAMDGGYRLPTTEIEAAMRISETKDHQTCWNKLQMMKACAADILMQKFIEASNAK